MTQEQALKVCLDVLLRMIPGYAKDAGLEQCTDEEHNRAIAAAAPCVFGADKSRWPAGVRRAADGLYD